ncbi:hypothetical protein PC114_g20313 [Phytophthora cactorum]|uniref:Uncharacterized protein n=1 Tax=Phytophthora cactorum TaxID=29920 RepID=A0A8T1B8A6_9STRA|nr:hypothetical protein PC114_g20313 [Phytophthora cactorum]KAG2897387.1 hypothetical protein PC115_g17203 [Phytophthora cactorum]
MALRRVLSLAAGPRRALASMQTPVTVSKAVAQSHLFSSGSGDADFVALHPSDKPHITNTPAAPESHDLEDLDDDDDAEETVAVGPLGVEPLLGFLIPWRGTRELEVDCQIRIDLYHALPVYM